MESRILDANILITGANGGIGTEVVKQLLTYKPRRIVLACRTKEKAESVLKQLPESSTQIEAVGGFDMNDSIAIKTAINDLPGDQKFDIVFLQSGGMVVSNRFEFVTVNGTTIERTVHQNAIGGLLTVKYLEELDLIHRNARIVFAGGEGARGIPKLIQKPDFKTRAEIN